MSSFPVHYIEIEDLTLMWQIWSLCYIEENIYEENLRDNQGFWIYELDWMYVLIQDCLINRPWMQKVTLKGLKPFCADVIDITKTPRLPAGGCSISFAKSGTDITAASFIFSTY